MKSVLIIEGALYSVHALVFFYFPANASTNSDIFLPKTFCIPREIIIRNFSYSGLVVSEELGNKQINKQTYSLTSYCLYRVISVPHAPFSDAYLNREIPKIF